MSENAIIDLYDISGAKVAEGSGKVVAPCGGRYIVKCNGNVVKVSVK